jgi:hypothetical protein
VANGDEPEMRFDIRPDLRPGLEQFLAAVHPTLSAVGRAAPITQLSP